MDEGEILRVLGEFRVGRANMMVDFGTYLSSLIGFVKTSKLIMEYRNNGKFSSFLE
jgi:hypothetical protein